MVQGKLSSLCTPQGTNTILSVENRPPSRHEGKKTANLLKLENWNLWIAKGKNVNKDTRSTISYQDEIHQQSQMTEFLCDLQQPCMPCQLYLHHLLRLSQNMAEHQLPVKWITGKQSSLQSWTLNQNVKTVFFNKNSYNNSRHLKKLHWIPSHNLWIQLESITCIGSYSEYTSI